jgi:hypothetical protein
MRWCGQTFFDFHLYKSHGFSQLSLTRPGPASSVIPNVLFFGASSRPGNSVRLVLIGNKQVGEKAAQMLANDNKFIMYVDTVKIQNI